MFKKLTIGKITKFKKRRNVVIGLGLGILMLSILLTGCQKSPVTIETLLVPEKADAIAKVRIAEMLNDEDIADLYARCVVTDPNAPQTLSLALDELRDETGVDLRYLKEAVVFADIAPIEVVADTATIEATGPYVGAIVECDIPAKQVFEILQLLRIKNYEVYTYSDYKIYSLADDINIAFLSSKLVAIGPRNVVEDIIDVGLGKSTPISAELYQLYESLGDPLVKGVYKVPPSVTQGIPIEIPIDMAACTFDKDNSIMYLQLQLYFASSAIASDSADIIQGLIAGVKYIYPQPEIRNMLNKVDVATYDSQVSLQAEATVDEVKDLISVLEDVL